jgi:hypothetical protein
MPGGAQPFTFQFGPWVPDLANVAVQMQFQYGATPVLCADVLNVFYADGCYRSMPGPADVAFVTLPAGAPLGAFTGIDAQGNPCVIMGSAGQLFALTPAGSIEFAALTGIIYGAEQWQFCQFGQSIYGVDGSAAASDGMIVYNIDDTVATPAGQIVLTGSITSNVLTVTAFASGYPANNLQVGTVISGVGVTLGTFIESLGSGTGSTGTYNLSTTPNLTSQTLYANIPPVGNVIATVGQFLMTGDIGLNFANAPYIIGEGTGSQTVFLNILPNVPLRPGSIFISSVAPGVGTHDNGLGQLIANASVASGTINYATGAIEITFTSAIPNGDTVYVTYTQAFPERVWWSAIGLPQFWPAPLTNAALAFQSSYEDLEGDLGPVMAIFGFPLYAIIFQRSGITRAIYQGGNVVFAFGTYEWKQGLVARSAAVQVGPNIYFLSDQGFFYTDGANVYPIGTAPDNSAGIDKWFWSNVNYSKLSSITGAYDASLRSVVFSICTGTNTTPDTLLIFNVLAQRWTRAQVGNALIWSDTDGTRHRLACFVNVSAENYEYTLFTSGTLSGYLETCDMMFVDGNSRTTVGVRPNVNALTAPTVQVGTRNTLQAALTYSPTSQADAFGGGFAPVLAQGLYTRCRVSAANANAIHGATMSMVMGGPV